MCGSVAQRNQLLTHVVAYHTSVVILLTTHQRRTLYFSYGDASVTVVDVPKSVAHQAILPLLTVVVAVVTVVVVVLTVHAKFPFCSL